MKNLMIVLFVGFISSFASAANWVHVSTEPVGKTKFYVDADTIRPYDGHIIDRNTMGFGTPSYYISAFVKHTPLEKPKKNTTLQYVFNCRNHSYFLKSGLLELTNGKTESANFNLTHSSQFEPIFPDTNDDNVAKFVCSYQ